MNKIFVECEEGEDGSLEVLTCAGEYAPATCWIKHVALPDALKAPRCFVVAETEEQRRFSTFWRVGCDPMQREITGDGAFAEDYVQATLRAVPVV